MIDKKFNSEDTADRHNITEGVWQIIGVGASDENGTFVMAMHTTKGRMQKNGWVPRQCSIKINPEIVFD